MPEQDVAVQRPVIIVGCAPVVGLATLEPAADLHDADGSMLFGKGILALLRREVRVPVLELLRRDKCHLAAQVDVVFQLGELPAQLVRRCADSVHDVPHGLLQKFQRALVGSDNALPVPLVHVDAVQVVQFLVAADGVHIGHNALTGAEAVLVQGVALPLSQTVDDFCLLVQAGHIERNRALDAVQVIVQAAALHDKQGSRDALEVQRHAELLLKNRLDEADGLLGVIQTQKALVSFRNGNVTHNTSSYFFPSVWFYALANWLSYSCL